MHILVVDDEPVARRRLCRQLAQLGFHDVSDADDGAAAIRACAARHVDLVFLDIHMPHNGLHAVRALGDARVIFVTADESQALSAFDVGARDYLLKPVSPERLATALARVGAVAPSGAGARTPQLPPPAPSGQLSLICTSHSGVQVFDARRIASFSAADKVSVFSIDGTEHISELSLQQLEARYAPLFIRVHRNTLVNLQFVSAVENGVDGWCVRLSDGNRRPVARRKLAALRAALRAHASTAPRVADRGPVRSLRG